MAADLTKMSDSRLEVSQVYQRLKDADEEEKKLIRPNSTRKGLTFLAALVAIIKLCVGTGLLSLPNAFHNAGLTTAIVLSFFIAFVNVHCMHILVRSNRILCSRFDKPTLSYAETFEYSILSIMKTRSKLATVGSVVVTVTVCVTQLGIGSVYFVFIADNLKQVVDFYQSSDGWPVSVYMSIILGPILLLNVIRRLENFSPFIVVANLCYLLGLLIILFYLCQHVGPAANLVQFRGWSTLPLYFGTFMFAFEFVAMVIPVMNDMETPGDFHKCLGVLNVGSSVVFLFYLLLGTLGYVAFGDKVLGSITLNLPVDQGLYQSVKLLFAVSIFFSYAIQFYAVAEMISAKLQTTRVRLNRFYFFSVEYGCKLVLILVTFAMAQILPHLGLIISLVGSVGLTTLGLIIPAAIETLTLGPTCWGRHRWILWKNSLLATYGLFILVSGVYASLRDVSNSP